jgi:hypothetical protein
MRSAELFEMAMVIAGGVGVNGLLRAYIRHRTRLRVERERTVRTAERARGLARLAGRRTTVVFDERDGDGHRVLRTGGTDTREEPA